MIRIRVKGKPGQIEGFLIWGHARFASYGNDIVCAGVSAVALSALIGLSAQIPGSIRYRILPQGLIGCRVAKGLPEKEARDTQLILTVMVHGLKAIRRSHKDVVDFTYRR